MLKYTALFAIILICFFIVPQVSFAQELSNGTAIGVTVGDKNIKDGDIISATLTGYKKTTTAYDAQVFGVVSMRPAVYLSNVNSKTDLPVISVGQVKVRVSAINGSIQRGDYITSSTIPGVGEKATENGFVVGTADQDFISNDPKKIGEIQVTLHPHFAKLSNDITRNLWNTVTVGFSAALETPLGLIRYAISGIITLLSFYFGFRFFARASNRGVEAIGRNPLAKQAILISVLFNTLITIAIMFFGVAIAYLILVL